MNALEKLNDIFIAMDIPAQTCAFTQSPPSTYVVMTPIIDTFECYADDLPSCEVQEIRLSLFTKGNYIEMKNRISTALLDAGFTITQRRYIGYESDTKYYHHATDVAKEYSLQEEE